MDVERFEQQLRRNARLIRPAMAHVGWYGLAATAAFVALWGLSTDSWVFLGEHAGELLLLLLVLAIAQAFMRFQLATVLLLRKHGILPPAGP